MAEDRRSSRKPTRSQVTDSKYKDGEACGIRPQDSTSKFQPPPILPPSKTADLSRAAKDPRSIPHSNAAKELALRKDDVKEPKVIHFEPTQHPSLDKRYRRPTKKPAPTHIKGTEHPDSTEQHSGIGNNDRTYLEGMASKSAVLPLKTATIPHAASKTGVVPKTSVSLQLATESLDTNRSKGIGNNDRTILEGMVSGPKTTVVKTAAVPKSAVEGTQPGTQSTNPSRGIGNNDRTFIEGMVSKIAATSKASVIPKIKVNSKTVSDLKSTGKSIQPGIKDSDDTRHTDKGVGNNDRTYVEGTVSRTSLFPKNATASKAVAIPKTVASVSKTAGASKTAGKTPRPGTEFQESTHRQGIGNNDRTCLEGMATRTNPSKQTSVSKKKESKSSTFSTAFAAKSSRPGTEFVLSTQKKGIGNSDRTYIEGMIPNSIKKSSQPPLENLNSYKNNTLISDTYPATVTSPLQTKSRASSNVKSIYTTPHDLDMASKQTKIKSLPPKEREQQDKWATKKLTMTDACPDAFEWGRVEEGYHCKGEHHFVTDELLAEGMRGVFLIGGDLEIERWGPYYASNERTKGLFWYAGPEPRPRESTAYIGETDEAGRAWLRDHFREGKGDGSKASARIATFVPGLRK